MEGKCRMWNDEASRTRCPVPDLLQATAGGFGAYCSITLTGLWSLAASEVGRTAALTVAPEVKA